MQKEEKNNILQFCLRLRLSNCVSFVTLRKSDKQKKNVSLMREILHALQDVSHAWRESMRNNVWA